MIEINEKTKKEVLVHACSGVPVVLGEWRSCDVEEKEYDDQFRPGRKNVRKYIVHQVEIAGIARPVKERLADDADMKKLVLPAWRGQVVIVQVLSQRNRLGRIECAGIVKPVSS